MPAWLERHVRRQFGLLQGLRCVEAGFPHPNHDVVAIRLVISTRERASITGRWPPIPRAGAAVPRAVRPQRFQLGQVLAGQQRLTLVTRDLVHGAAALWSNVLRNRS